MYKLEMFTAQSLNLMVNNKSRTNMSNTSKAFWNYMQICVYACKYWSFVKKKERENMINVTTTPLSEKIITGWVKCATSKHTRSKFDVFYKEYGHIIHKTGICTCIYVHIYMTDRCIYGPNELNNHIPIYFYFEEVTDILVLILASLREREQQHPNHIDVVLWC